jgi:hypothetical protein
MLALATLVNQDLGCLRAVPSVGDFAAHLLRLMHLHKLNVQPETAKLLAAVMALFRDDAAAGALKQAGIQNKDAELELVEGADYRSILEQALHSEKHVVQASASKLCMVFEACSKFRGKMPTRDSLRYSPAIDMVRAQFFEVHPPMLVGVCALSLQGKFQMCASCLNWEMFC